MSLEMPLVFLLLNKGVVRNGPRAYQFRKHRLSPYKHPFIYPRVVANNTDRDHTIKASPYFFPLTNIHFGHDSLPSWARSASSPDVMLVPATPSTCTLGPTKVTSTTVIAFMPETPSKTPTCTIVVFRARATMSALVSIIKPRMRAIIAPTLHYNSSTYLAKCA
jgi:hypothetical protein